MEKQGKFKVFAERIVFLLSDKGKATDKEYSAAKLAADLGIDIRMLSLVFNQEMKTTYPKYVNRLRIEKAVRLLKKKEKNLTIEEVGERCGFRNRMSFYLNFNKVLGITPKEYRDGKYKMMQRSSVSVSCLKITLKTLAMKFPEDTLWQRKENKWHGYSPSRETIFIIGDGKRKELREVFPVTIISSVGEEQIEIENV